MFSLTKIITNSTADCSPPFQFFSFHLNSFCRLSKFIFNLPQIHFQPTSNAFSTYPPFFLDSLFRIESLTIFFSQII